MVRSPNSHLENRMITLWGKRESVSFWLLILVLFPFREIQAEYHWNEVKFTAVSTDRSLLDFTGIAVIDDIQWISYYKLNHQIAVKVDWISDVLGTDFIEEMCHLIKSHERDAVSLIHFLTGNDTKTERNNTMQYILGCELDDDIKLNSKIRIGLDGETMIEFDEHQRHWVVQSPRAENLKPIVESLFWTNLRKRYVKQYCVDVVQKVIQNSTMKENMPPEVVVSRHDSPNGTITFSCLVTGFYPKFIMLIWKKANEQAIWGKESSSGTLPNADGTFYLRITLELPVGDSGAGYTCVVEHRELKKTTIYPGECFSQASWAKSRGLSCVILQSSTMSITSGKWPKDRHPTRHTAYFPCKNCLPLLLLICSFFSFSSWKAP
uniref:Ig-like domain-containing protein n=1 Tax=Monodelphis domestica TaxID=13616 RepID=A0A5F8GQX6_MONDO